MDWRDVSITAIAKEQVALIRQCQPEKTPYCLLGWSNAGVIALAMAHELERQGESVAFLGILDTQPHVETYSRDLLSDTDEMLAYIRSDRKEDFLRLPEEERVALQRQLRTLSEDERVDYAVRWAKDKQFLSEEEAHSSMEMLKDGICARQGRRIVYARAGKPSHPCACPCVVEHKDFATPWKGAVNWSDYTTGNGFMDTVTGDHMDVVHSIQVHQRISDILAKVRNKAYKRKMA